MVEVPPGMLLGAHGLCFESKASREAHAKYESDKKSFLKALLRGESWDPASLNVLLDPDEDTVGPQMRCYEIGPGRALPVKWVYSKETGKLIDLLWSKYDAWNLQRLSGDTFVFLDHPREESIEKDMERWFNGSWKCKPF